MSTSIKSDISLSLFKESVIPHRHSSLGIQAYRMDSDGGSGKVSAMTEYAGLNKCNKPFCCDYLYIKNQQAVLIEDTHLEATTQNILKELNNEKDDHSGFDNIASHNKAKQKYIKQFIKKKYCLKVYGSLLILCRLTQKYINISKELKNKNFSFWLVINDLKNVSAIDSMGLKPFLQTSMTDSLTKKNLVKNTEIFFVHQLEKKLKKLQ